MLSSNLNLFPFLFTSYVFVSLVMHYYMDFNLYHMASFSLMMAVLVLSTLPSISISSLLVTLCVFLVLFSSLALCSFFEDLESDLFLFVAMTIPSVVSIPGWLFFSLTSSLFDSFFPLAVALQIQTMDGVLMSESQESFSSGTPSGGSSSSHTVPSGHTPLSFSQILSSHWGSFPLQDRYTTIFTALHWDISARFGSELEQMNFLESKFPLFQSTTAYNFLVSTIQPGTHSCTPITHFSSTFHHLQK